MKICMMNSSLADMTEEIEFAGTHGFQGFELAFEYPGSTPEQVLDRSSQILDSFSSYNLARVAHTQAFLNICDCYESVRKASLRETVKAMGAARKLDINFVTVHPGFMWPPMIKREAVRRSLKSFRALLKVAGELDLTIGVENMPARFFPPLGYFNRTEDFEMLFSQVASDRLKFVLDVAHASFRESEPASNFISKLHGKLAHVHLSDNLGERDDHLPLGVGRVDYRSAMKGLRERNYDQTLTLEIFTRDRDYLLLSKKKLEELLAANPSPKQ